MRLLMVDHGVSVGVLTRANNIKAVHPAFSAFTRHVDCDVVTAELRAKVDCGRVVTGIRPERCGRGGYMKRVNTLALHLVMFQVSAIL